MTIREALSAELTDAMRRRDTAAASALRSSLAAVANAEAPPAPEPPGDAPAIGHGASSIAGSIASPIAGSVAGLGATEAPRVHLTDDQVRAIVTREHAELVGHAERLTRLCRRDEADAARRAADCLAAVLAGDTSRSDAG